MWYYFDIDTHNFHNSRSYRSGQEKKVCFPYLFIVLFYKNSTMNLLYAIYDPFQCGNNLVILINEKPDNISISRETNEWAYHAYGNLFERNTIGTGAHVPKDEF